MALKSKDLATVRPDVPVHMVRTSASVRLNINRYKGERDEWQIAAVRMGMDVTTLVHEAVRKYLHEHVSK